MSIETGLYALLSANGAVSALVATRIYPVIAPEACAWPSIVYHRISTPRLHTLDNAADTPHPRFQITCWAEDFKGCAALELAVRNVLAGFTGLADDTTVQAVYVVDQRDAWDFPYSTMGLYRRDLDLEIWYSEP